jgi:Lrp/AsnC family leucine-responsive transcriptional regulator
MRLPQVVSADWVAGETDVLLSVVARSLDELQRVLVALSSRGGAQRVVTLLRLRELKPPSPLPVD